MIQSNGTVLWNCNKIMSNPLERHKVAELNGIQRVKTDRGRELVRDGYLNLPQLFTEDKLAQVKGYFSARPAMQQEGPLHHVPIGDIVQCSGVLKAACDQENLELIAEYLGCPGTLVDLAVFWSISDKELAGNQIWHRDRDDFRSLKIFVYLTNCGPNNGPHEFIKGSHVIGLPAKFYAGNCRSVGNDIEAELSAGKVQFTGESGTTWIEATYGIHRGLPVKDGIRGVLEFMYAQNTYPGREERLGRCRLTQWPSGIPDNDLTRHALRLIA